MQKILSAEEMREVDRLTTEKYGIPSLLLMENAAHAAARAITEKLGGSVKGKSFLILCGKGNNGGDGAALARILWSQGASIQVNLFGKIEEMKGEAKANFEIIKNLTLESDDPKIMFWEIESLEVFWSRLKYTYERALLPIVIVDAVFGTGLTRKLENEYQELAATISNLDSVTNRKNILIVSLDIPSGLNSDAAVPIGENLKADLTVTFTAPKLANVLPPASDSNGKLVVANIGSPQELIENSPSKTFLAEKSDAQNWLRQTEFSAASYKNKRGHALIVAGSKDYSGAAVLCGEAAIVSGVGLVTMATPESARQTIAAKIYPEVMIRGVAETTHGAISQKAVSEILELIEGKIDAVAVGSGLSSGENSTRKFVREFVEQRKTPVVIDADGLNSLAPFDLQGSEELPLILTPHQGEFLRLLGTEDQNALKDRVGAARAFAEKHKVILVLKGERTLIAAPDGRVVINPTGNSGLGKAGNGDTLTGIITGFIAQAVQLKIDIYETVVAAVYLAGTAGDIAAERIGRRSMLASDVRECLGEAFQRMREV